MFEKEVKKILETAPIPDEKFDQMVKQTTDLAKKTALECLPEKKDFGPYKHRGFVLNEKSLEEATENVKVLGFNQCLSQVEQNIKEGFNV